jgi:putative ABC transport system ATP-binding protein
MDISLSNVTVKVGAEQRVLFKIPSLAIKTDEKLLIKGASGKGKTTFLHMLAGLFTPNEGRIDIGGTKISHLDDEARCLFRRAHMGVVFQKLNLIEHLTALENIQLSLKREENLERAFASLKAVGLQGREHDRTGVLSLGEQQRVAIARVLAGEPSIVLADEPTSSLDEKNAFDVTELLLKACVGKTLIVVSHDHRIEKYFSEIKDFGELIA